MIIEESVTITRPPEEVFCYIVDLSHLPEYIELVSNSTGVPVPANTPIDPVMVLGSARIRSAGHATKYPPDAATSPMDTNSGLPAW